MGIMQAVIAGHGAGGGIEVVGSTISALDVNAVGNDATIAYPSGIMAGDLLILCVYDPILADMITDGWTLEYSSGASINRYHFYSRVAAGGETGNLTYSTRLTDNIYEASLFVVRGWGAIDPAAGEEGTTGNLPGITMTAPGLWLQVCSGIATISTPAGLLGLQRETGATDINPPNGWFPEATTGYKEVAAGATGSNTYGSSGGLLWGAFGIGITAA